MKRPTGTRFFKLEALGNDFVLIDARDAGNRTEGIDPIALADRRTGIGFDQLLVLHPDASATARVEIRNADGSAAEQCGNGMRAIGAWLAHRGELGRGVDLITPAGPVRVRTGDPGYTAVLPGPTRITAASLGLDDPRPPAGLADFALVSTGNAHLVLLSPRAPTRVALRQAVAAVQSRPGWRDAVNISLAHIESPGRVGLRVHERGTGPTMACGSAACAVAWIVAGDRPGPIVVTQPGGDLVVDFDREGGRVETTGPARVVFEGHIA